jgi:zinc protease
MTKNGVFKTKLKNGLTVLLKESHTAPVTTWWVSYRVGSRDEHTGITGASHWVEHMMFKGTRRFPPGVLDKVISRCGGLWNAFTSLDRTIYFETLPSGKIDIGLELEADRMRHSIFSPKEVESERTVIISERQGSENEPEWRLYEQMLATAFHVHPYRHEILGDMADLHTMTRDDLFGHYKTYYVPNNAIAVAVGDFKTRDMLARIKELYEKIPGGSAPPRLARPEPEQKGERRVIVEGDDETPYVGLGFHAVSATDPDFHALVILDSVLAGASSIAGRGGTSNKSSRLYKALVESELAADISGGIFPTVDPYLYTLFATVRNGHKPDEVEKALDAEIERAMSSTISEAELAKAIKQARAMFAFGAESVTNQGMWLSYAELFDTYQWFQKYLDRLAAVTVDDVRRVAQKVLRRSNRTTGWYVPNKTTDS